jgi:hypothetical protein
MGKITAVEKAKDFFQDILVPTGLVFPTLLIFGGPALLWLWLANPRSFSSYLLVLWWTLVWIGVPGKALLSQAVAMDELPPGSIGGVLAVYVIPLVLLGTVIYLLLVKRSVPKHRAIWLGVVWSIFVLQVLGTILMAYLWATGV